MPLGGPQARAVLALLLTHPNQTVSTDAIVDELWPEGPPASGVKTIHKRVSELRRVFGTEAHRLATVGRGYRLSLGPEQLDATRFEELVARAADAANAAELLDEALSMWRGPPLAGLPDGVLVGERTRLEELRQVATEARIDIDLTEGDPAATAATLEDLTTRHPLRERLWGQLMVALYRSGRQADALRAYQRLRSTLANELGLEPSAELRTLERRILAHDPTLEPQQARPSEPTVEPAPAERRVVTVVVADLESELEADPEDHQRRAGRLHEAAEEVAARLGGNLVPQAGAELLIVFGRPAHEDDAERGVRAALALRSLAPIGVATGWAVVSGDEPRVEGAVVSEAKRLQRDAGLGAVAVTDATHRATRYVIAYDQVGPHRVATGLRPRVADEADGSPLVGRDRELDVLAGAFARGVDERSVRLVTILGEPGIGKTRLVRELHRRLTAQPIRARWLEGRCVPYREQGPYWPIAQMLRASLGADDRDSPDDVSAKLRSDPASMAATAQEREWLTARLAPLASVRRADIDTAGGDPVELHRAWVRYIELVGQTEALVLAFEDVHWADTALTDFIDHVVDFTVDTPLLVVCTARPELLDRIPSWGGGKRNSTVATLDPLDEQETTRLVESLRRDLGLGAETVAAAPQRSGGNPLYASELLRMLADDASRTGAELPDSINAVIAARLDLLPTAERSLLQAAAVLGDGFTADAAAAVLGIDFAAANDGVTRLGQRGLICRSSHRRDIYAFSHILTREVAYRQLPRRARLRMHTRATDWLESEGVQANADQAAHHAVEALILAQSSEDEADSRPLADRAVRLLVLAGDRAHELDASQALDHYRRASELVSDPSVERADVLTKLGSLAADTRNLDEAQRHLTEAVQIYATTGVAAGEGRALAHLGRLMWVRGDADASDRLLSEALEILEPLGPSRTLAHALAAQATQQSIRGDAQAALRIADRALALARRFESPEDEIRMLTTLGMAKAGVGDGTGEQDLDDALALSLRRGLSNFAAIAYNNLANVRLWAGGPAEATVLIEQGLALTAQRGLGAMADWLRHTLVVVLYDSDDWDRAVAVGGEILAREANEGGSHIGDGVAIWMSRIHYWRDEAERVAALQPRSLERARAVKDTQHLAPALTLAAHVARDEGDTRLAADLLGEMAAVTERRPHFRVAELPDATRLLVALGSGDTAAELVGRAEPTTDRGAACLLTGRAVVAEHQGAHQDAATLYAQAEQVWAARGSPFERGHAAFGLGRCRPDDHATLERARAAFAGLGARRVLRHLDRHD